jgi:hypothetical protein
MFPPHQFGANLLISPGQVRRHYATAVSQIQVLRCGAQLALDFVWDWLLGYNISVSGIELNGNDDVTFSKRAPYP